MTIAVAGMTIAVAGMTIAVAGTAIAVAGTAVAVAGTAVAVAGTAVAVAGTAVAVAGMASPRRKRPGYKTTPGEPGFYLCLARFTGRCLAAWGFSPRRSEQTLPPVLEN
ncbi:MAG: hypothetical protein IPF56_08220 [Chloroflexi bacterium]|nr:hypothetical protein [Chloroflexota bacterium]